MIKRRIIATKLSITKQGEIKFFQVKIPFDAKVIIGIETAMRLKTYVAPPLPIPNIAVPGDNPNGNVLNFNLNIGDNSPGFPVNRFSGFGTDFFVSPPPVGIVRSNSLVGELKLQSSDDSNVFYATNVSDHSVKEGLEKVPTVNFITENIWTHGCKRELEKVLVDGNTTVLAGLYKDKLGEMLKFDVSYDVFVYVWYKFETKKNDNQSCP